MKLSDCSYKLRKNYCPSRLSKSIVMHDKFVLLFSSEHDSIAQAEVSLRLAKAYIVLHREEEEEDDAIGETLHLQNSKLDIVLQIKLKNDY